LNETVNRNDDGSALEECGEMDANAIDISAPGTEVHVDDISQLSPEEAFAAGMAAARDAIDQVMGGPDGPPPDGGFSGSGPMGEPAMQETALDETGARVKAAGLDPQSLGDTGKVIAQVTAMLEGGEVTPENARILDLALRRRLKKNPSPEEVSHLQALLRDVRAAGGIRDKRPDDSAWHRGEAAAELAAQKAGERSTFDSFSAMGLGTPTRGWEE